MTSRAKKGKTTLVEDLPEFDVAKIPDLVTNDLPVAVAEGVQKGIDALPEEIPAAIQKGIDAIPPEIPEAVAAGSERVRNGAFRSGHMCFSHSALSSAGKLRHSCIACRKDADCRSKRNGRVRFRRLSWQ